MSLELLLLLGRDGDERRFQHGAVRWAASRLLCDGPEHRDVERWSA